VDDDVAASSVVDRLLPERLWRMQRVTGLPVAFGGPAQAAAGGRQIVLTRLSGTLGDSLRGVTVGTGRGLGGLVLRDRAAQRVGDYASARPALPGRAGRARGTGHPHSRRRRP
jgi:hypothetical protein